jgi:hypothetical protein
MGDCLRNKVAMVTGDGVATIRYTGIPYITYYATKAGILGLTHGIRSTTDCRRRNHM